MERGEVRQIQLAFSDGVAKGKYVVALQGGLAYSKLRDVAVVVASSKRTNQFLREHEIEVGRPEGFDHETVIDGRWVYTIAQDKFQAGSYLCTLSPEVMERLSEAIAVGLDLF